MAALHCYVQPLRLSELWRWWEFPIGGMLGQKNSAELCKMGSSCSRKEGTTLCIPCGEKGEERRKRNPYIVLFCLLQAFRAKHRSGKKQLRVISKLEELNILCVKHTGNQRKKDLLKNSFLNI